MTRLANLHSIKWWGEEGGSLQLCLPTSELQLNRNISGKEGYVAIPEAEGTKPGQAAMNAAQRGASWVTLPTMHLCTLVQVRCFNIVHTARREHRVRFSSPRPSHAEPAQRGSGRSGPIFHRGTRTVPPTSPPQRNERVRVGRTRTLVKLSVVFASFSRRGATVPASVEPLFPERSYR